MVFLFPMPLALFSYVNQTNLIRLATFPYQPKSYAQVLFISNVSSCLYLNSLVLLLLYQIILYLNHGTL